jgi:hypothetical protein
MSRENVEVVAEAYEVLGRNGVDAFSAYRFGIASGGNPLRRKSPVPARSQPTSWRVARQAFKRVGPARTTKVPDSYTLRAAPFTGPARTFVEWHPHLLTRLAHRCRPRPA